MIRFKFLQDLICNILLNHLFTIGIVTKSVQQKVMKCQHTEELKKIKNSVKKKKGKIMESVQFGSEVSDSQEELVRLNLKILSMIESFVIIETQADMDRLNGEIRLKLDLMRKGVENLRTLARHQVNSDSAVMLKADANSHEDQMTGCHLAFKKANIACMSRLYAKGKENLMSKVRSLTFLFIIT